MIKQALVAPFLLAFLVPFASLAQSPLEDAGCTRGGTDYYCPQVSFASLEVTYLDDVECYSTGNQTCTNDCKELVDIGCFGFVAVNRDAQHRVCDVFVNATTVSYYRDCRDEVLRGGTNVTLLLNPEIIDYSACSKNFTEGLYVIHCPYSGRVQYANVSILQDGMVILSAADIPGTSLETVLIISLVVAIALVAFWVLRPARAGAAAGERRLRRRERRQ